MLAVVLELHTGEELCIFANEGAIDAATQTKDVLAYRVLDAPSPSPEEALSEVLIRFTHGTNMICYLPSEHVDKASKLQAVTSIEISQYSEYVDLLSKEAEIDNRLQQAYAVMNNHPNKQKRAKLHRGYLEHKDRFVSALEALIDNII